MLMIIACLLVFDLPSYASQKKPKQDVGKNAKVITIDEVEKIEKTIQEQADQGWNFTGMTEEEIKKVEQGGGYIDSISGEPQEDPPSSNKKDNETAKSEQKTEKGSGDKSKDGSSNKDSNSSTKPGDSVPGGKDVLPEKDIAWKNKVIGTTKVNSKFENVIGGPGGSVQMIPIPLKWTKEIMDEGWKDDDETILNAKYFKELGWVIEGDPEKTYYIDVKMSETFIDTSSVNTKYWEWNLGKAHQNGKNKIKQNTLDIKNMWAIFPAPGEYIVTATPYETYDIGSIYTQYKVYQTKETKYEYVKKTRKVPKTVYEYDWDDYIPSNYYRGQLPVKKKTIYVTETYYEKVPKDKYYVHIDFIKNHFIKKTETSPPKPNEKRKVTIKIIVPAQEVGKKIYFLWFINGPIEVNTDTHISK